MKVGIFGVTGNPPHLGHLTVMLEALKDVDEVWATPVFNHAFGKNFIEYADRLNMLTLLLNEFKPKNVIIKELDKEFFEKKHETVYSYNLLSSLKEQYSNIDFKLIIGEDNYKPEVWNRFFKYKELENEFGLVIIKESGAHSTQIRELINLDKPIKQFVGLSVEKYIKENNLYKDKEGIKCKI